MNKQHDKPLGEPVKARFNTMRGNHPTSRSEIERRYRGMSSKIAGEQFEKMIEASCEWYKQQGLACIDKTPEPMKPLSRPNYMGQFLACYTKAAQPDFKGTTDGGLSVVFEAKHTDDDRIKYDRLTGDQMDDLEMHHKLGAVAFVLVSFGLESFHRIPWPIWREMKERFGRKYITRKEAEPFRVPYVSGAIRLLDCCSPFPDTCVSCGKYAGEGAHVCPDCKAKGAKL